MTWVWDTPGGRKVTKKGTQEGSPKRVPKVPGGRGSEIRGHP